MKREPLITVTDTPDPRVEKLIGDGLRRYNAEKSGIDDSRALAVVVSDPDTREILGGISGRTSRGLLFVDLVYLPDTLRGEGLGRRLLALAEEEGGGAAAARPCSIRAASRRRASTCVGVGVCSARFRAIRPAAAASS